MATCCKSVQWTLQQETVDDSWMKPHYLSSPVKREWNCSFHFTERLCKACSIYNAEQRLSSVYNRETYSKIISWAYMETQHCGEIHLTQIQLMQIKPTPTSCLNMFCHMHRQKTTFHLIGCTEYTWEGTASISSSRGTCTQWPLY